LLRPFAGVLEAGDLHLARGEATEVDGVICALDGAVYSCPELAERLGVDASPEALLALGYRRWGADLPSLLRGEFTLLLWDARAGRGLLVPDQLGVRRVVVRRSGRRLWFATEIRYLLPLLRSRPAPDPLALSRWLTGSPAPGGATLYEGIECPGPGELVELGPAGGSTRRYWKPRYREPLDLPRPELAAQIRGELERAVARRTSADAPTGVLMSGGLDSTSVAVLAQRVAGADVRGFSATFPGYPRIDESPWIEALESRTGLPGLHLAAQPRGILASGVEYLAEWQLPLHAWNEAWTQPLLAEAAAMGVTAMLSGEGGDELFGSRLLLTADLLRAGRPLSALRFARGLPEAGGRAARRVLARVLWQFGLAGVPPASVAASWRRLAQRGHGGPWWASRRLLRLLDEGPQEPDWRAAEGPRWWAYLSHGLTAGIHGFGLFDHVRRRSEQQGLEARHPLFDLDLFELMMRVPPPLCSEGRLTRPLLRQAMAGLSPDVVRLRPDKSVFDDLVTDALVGAELPALRELLGSGSEIRAYARGDAIAELLAQPPPSQRGDPGVWVDDVLRLVAIELWLRYQADRELPQKLLDGPLLAAPQYRLQAVGGSSQA